jgi:hypothetical protein
MFPLIKNEVEVKKSTFIKTSTAILALTGMAAVYIGNSMESTSYIWMFPFVAAAGNIKTTFLYMLRWRTTVRFTRARV